MKNLAEVIDYLGVNKVALLCGVSVRAVYKWRKANSLPRTEYTSETNYAYLLSTELNGRLSQQDILDIGKPVKPINLKQ